MAAVLAGEAAGYVHRRCGHALPQVGLVPCVEIREPEDLLPTNMESLALD